jgi:hypothetical protein
MSVQYIFRATKMPSGGLAHFGATIVFWLAAGVLNPRAETNQREHLV